MDTMRASVPERSLLIREALKDYPDPPEFEKCLLELSKRIIRQQCGTQNQVYLAALEFFSQKSGLSAYPDFWRHCPKCGDLIAPTKFIGHGTSSACCCSLCGTVQPVSDGIFYCKKCLHFECNECDQQDCTICKAKLSKIIGSAADSVKCNSCNLKKTNYFHCAHCNRNCCTRCYDTTEYSLQYLFNTFSQWKGQTSVQYMVNETWDAGNQYPLEVEILSVSEGIVEMKMDGRTGIANLHDNDFVWSDATKTKQGIRSRFKICGSSELQGQRETWYIAPTFFDV